MERVEQIRAAATAYTKGRCPMVIGGDRFKDKMKSINANFIAGAEWADENPKSPWISVEERLPEPEKEVIVLANDKYIDIDQLVDNGEDGCYWLKNNEWICRHKITHWMPIPELL